MRAPFTITKNPGGSVTRAGAEILGSWINTRALPHPAGTLQAR